MDRGEVDLDVSVRACLQIPHGFCAAHFPIRIIAEENSRTQRSWFEYPKDIDLAGLLCRADRETIPICGEGKEGLREATFQDVLCIFFRSCEQRHEPGKRLPPQAHPNRDVEAELEETLPLSCFPLFRLLSKQASGPYFVILTGLRI